MKKFTFLPIADKGILSIAVSQFGMAFSNNFVMVIMPFYILKISPLNHQATMLWIGLIMGGPSIATTVAAPFWGGLTSRMSPKFLFERAMLCSAVVIMLMGFVDNLYMLFALRTLQGTLGGASTIGLILTSSISPPEKISGNISLFQNAITAGQLLGPPAGAYAAGLLGYHFPFFMAFALIITFLIFFHLHVRYTPPQGTPPRTEASMKKNLILGWFLCLIGTIHLTFLPSILPDITKAFHMAEREGLGAAGIIMMTYTGSAILGSYVLCRISMRVGLNKVMTTALLMAAFFQLLHIFSAGVVSFVVLRMLQCAFIAAVFPLTLSIFARQVGGKVIGFLNAARFFGNAAGPILAASILAFADLQTLYLAIAGLTLCFLWFFLMSMRTETENRRGAVCLS